MIHKLQWLSLFRRAALILAGFLLYGYELYNATLLLLTPTNSTPISVLAALLVGIYVLGLTRAWQLLGGRSYRLSDWLSPLHYTQSQPSGARADQALSESRASKDESR